ncbi:MAG: hypothetical protein QOD81_2966 [Solirubrobacteraceae bacterium]|jgi:hypothetical protein|nr:hypothetical protein [Solirubrobacteraceae bacterium]
MRTSRPACAGSRSSTRSATAVACPGRGGAEVERLLSTFAGVGSGGGTAPLPDYSRMGANRSAGCGPGCGHAH